MYYLIESKDNSIKIVYNIFDYKKKENIIYNYCLQNNIMRIKDKKSIKLSGKYCIKENDFKYSIYDAGKDGYIFNRHITHHYDLVFIKYEIDSQRYIFNRKLQPELKKKLNDIMNNNLTTS